MHSDKKRCADTLSLSRQAEQNRAEERVSIDTKKGSKYNKSNEKRGGGIQLKKRKWKFRIAGGAVTLLGIYLMAVGYGETITLTIATVVLIFGIAIWSMATPENYNSMTDMIAILQEQCSNIAVNLHGSPLKVGSIDPYKPENAICIQKDGMFLAYPGEYGYEIRPLISVGYISILKRLEMDCGAMMRFDIKGGDRLPLPVREKGQILTRVAQLNSKLCYVITLDGCVPGVVSDQYVPLPYIDLLKAMKKVVTKEHPDLEFHSGTLSFEYLIANYWLNDPVMEQSLALTMKNAGCDVKSIRAGIRFSSSDLGLSSVFLSMFLEINGISMPLGTGIQMEHKGDKASVEVFEEKCGELGSVLQANEDRIEELGNMDVKDVPGVVATLVKKNAFLPKKAAEKVLEDLRLQMTSGTGIDVYLALNQIIQMHSTMQKVSDERFLAMSEGVAKLIHTDFSKVTVLEEE